VGSRARIATVCQGGRFKSSREANREYVMALLDRALGFEPDLVCLPEAFTLPGTGGMPLEEKAEPVPGPTVEAAARRAKAHQCYIICPVKTARDGRLWNSAVIIDRAGEVCGAYDKTCPVTSTHDYTVMEGGVMPGGEPPVFNLDFGRIGIQICFDAGFPENWQILARQGARLVLWPSAYDGGFPLRAYAYLHHYYVVSSTRTGHSRVIDPLGAILAETDRYADVLVRDINLDFVAVHGDFNGTIPRQIQQAYANRVEVRDSAPGSGHFLVEPIDDTITTAQLQEEFGFESTFRYHDRHRGAYRHLRDGQPPPPQDAAHGDRTQYTS